MPHHPSESTPRLAGPPPHGEPPRGRRALAGCAAALALALGACASSSGIGPEATALDDAGLGLTAGVAVQWPREDWWTAFGDPQLDRLIERALAGGPSIKIAQARVRLAQQAEAQATAAGGGALDLNLRGIRQRLPEHYIYPPPLAGITVSDGRAALDFEYEFDFWGSYRAGRQAAALISLAARAEAASVRLVLASAIARAYSELALRHEELALAKQIAAQREAVVQVLASRQASGLDHHGEVEPPKAQAAAAQQQAAALEERIEVLRIEIVALAGGGPGSAPDIRPPAMAGKPAPQAPAALPAELLGRRPDLLAQRLRAEAAARQVAAAKAQFYPNIDLTAFFGFQALGFNHLFDAANRTYGIGPALDLPLFDSGRRRANLGSRFAEYDYAVEQYNATLIGALQEVADAGAALRWSARQREAAERALAALRRAERIAEARQRAGLAGALPPLTARGAVLEQRGVLAQLADRERQVALALIKALGGGYAAPAEIPAATLHRTFQQP